MWNGWQDWTREREMRRRGLYKEAFGLLYGVKPAEYFTMTDLLRGSRRGENHSMVIDGYCEAIDHAEYWRSDELPCALITSHVYRWDLKRDRDIAYLKEKGFDVIEPGMLSWYNDETTLIVIRRHVPWGEPNCSNLSNKEWHELSERKVEEFVRRVSARIRPVST